MILERELNNSNYLNESESFYIKKKAFEYQYAPLYAERLTSIRPELQKNALQKWDNKYQIKSLVDLDKNTKSIIIGTLYKEMQKKPNILKELAEDENNMIPFQPIGHREKYMGIDDELILEDEVQRIKLIDSSDQQENKNIIKNNIFCTGLVVALLGYEDDESKFVILDYCFKETPYPEKPIPLKDDKYIVFLSGIELNAQKSMNLFKLQLLIDYLNGDFLNSDYDNEQETEKTEYEKKLEEILSKTNRLIIAGNSLSSTTQSKGMHKQAKYLTKNFVAASVTPIKQLDEFLLQLTDKIDVDIMPGEFDPSNLMVPQQPLHHAMFTKTVSRYSSKQLHTCTNPYRFKTDQISFLGTSGQFIDDIRRTTDIDDSIDLMKLTLNAGHIGPTCPDTLACYPYYGKDPFILKQLPHVYFCGNQDKFQQDIYKDSNKNEIHLLSLPRFSETSSCVFFNLRTFESEEICF